MYHLQFGLDQVPKVFQSLFPDTNIQDYEFRIFLSQKYPAILISNSLLPTSTLIYACINWDTHREMTRTEQILLITGVLPKSDHYTVFSKTWA